MKWYKGATGGFDRTRWDEVLNLFNLKKLLKFTRIRIVADPIKVQTHWIKWPSEKGGMAKAPIICPRLDPDEGKFKKGVECLGCEVGFTVPESNKLKEFKKKRFNNSERYYTKIIIRPLQKAGRRPYVRNTVIPQVVYNALGELSDLAITKLKDKYGAKVAAKFEKEYDPVHPKYGFDFLVKYNKDAKTPASAYSVQFVGITPLTPKEIKDIAKSKPVITGDLVKFSSEENIESLLKKSNLIKLIDVSKLKDSKKNKSDDEDSDDSSKSDGEYTYNAIMKMKEDELLDIADDIGMSVKKLKSKSLKAIRNLVAEELELEEPDDENDDDKSGEEDDTEMPDLDNMDKEDLVEFILENDLDIPKPKSKKASVLRKLIEIELSSKNDDDKEEKEDDYSHEEEDDDFFNED